MKSLFKLIALLAFVCIYTSSCKQDKPVRPATVPSEILARIKELGYSTNSVKMLNNGYVVEGDIFLTETDLGLTQNIKNLRIAGTEQYRANNLVVLPTYSVRTISISISGLSPFYTEALDTAISKYNSLNLGIDFERVSAGGEINVAGYYQQGGDLAYAYYPSGGDPGDSIKVNTVHYSPSDVLWLAKVIQHEIGHCIGLQHTDYSDISYSCLYAGNHTGHPAGTIHIPGTPTTPDAGSFMLACVIYGSPTFNYNDQVALTYLYPRPLAPPLPPTPPVLPGVSYFGRAVNGTRTYFFYGNGTTITAGVIVDPVKQFTVTHFTNGKVTLNGLTGRMYATDENNSQYTFVLSGMDFQPEPID